MQSQIHIHCTHYICKYILSRHSLCDRNGNTKLFIDSNESKHRECACAKQTKHLGEVLGVFGKQA